jgi:di/tricarboxylate transporter
VVAVMFSATLAFATPVGYQTNMMVYGPGGYRFLDFTRVGLPLNIIVHAGHLCADPGDLAFVSTGLRFRLPVV